VAVFVYVAIATTLAFLAINVFGVRFSHRRPFK
jgi:hypothetical protein